MAKRNTALRLGLLVTAKREADYFHVRASIVSIGLTPSEIHRIDHPYSGDEAYKPDGSFNKIRNIDEANGWHFNDLTVNSQGEHRDYYGSTENRRLYGWEVRYQDAGSVDLSRAKSMADTLSKLERKQTKLSDQYGYPATFGAYLARVADALGIQSFVFAQDDSQGLGWSYDDADWTIVDVKQGIYKVDAIVDTWIKEGKPSVEHVEA